MWLLPLVFRQLGFQECFQSQTKGEKSKSHFHHFPTLLKCQGLHVVHAALWCKPHVRVETYQLQLRSSCDKSASRVSTLPTNYSASKKLGLFCSGLIGFFTWGFLFVFNGGKKKKRACTWCWTTLKSSKTNWILFKNWECQNSIHEK